MWTWTQLADTHVGGSIILESCCLVLCLALYNQCLSHGSEQQLSSTCAGKHPGPPTNYLQYIQLWKTRQCKVKDRLAIYGCTASDVGQCFMVSVIVGVKKTD